jgi:hypothetical protein
MLKLFALLQSRQPIGDRSTCSRPRSRRNDCGVSDYWADLIRLLQIFVETNHRRIEALKAKMVFAGYAYYIATRQRRPTAKPEEAPAPAADATETATVEGV